MNLDRRPRGRAVLQRLDALVVRVGLPHHVREGGALQRGGVEGPRVRDEDPVAHLAGQLRRARASGSLKKPKYASWPVHSGGNTAMEG